MKKSNKNTWLPITLIGAILMIAACEETAETYDEFTQDGEKIYVGTPDTVLVSPGFEKLQFSVVINADPKISSGVLQTKDKSITHEFDVTRQNIGQDTVNFTVDLEEGEYNFDVTLKDDAGNESVPREINTIVYGENYRSALITRGIANLQAFRDTVIVEWGDVPDGGISTLFTYEDATGTIQTMEIPNDTTETVLDSYQLGGQITVSSSYKPSENAIEIFNSLNETTFPDKFILNKSPITALKLPFDASEGCHGSTYARLTDGKTGEYWHSCDTPEDQYPFVMSFDLGTSVNLRGFKLDERADCCGGRSPGAYQIWGINDLTGAETVDIDADEDEGGVSITHWEADATAKGWVKLLDVADNAQTTFDVDIPESTMAFRYVRVVCISSIDGDLTANFNEFTFKVVQ